MRKKKNTHTHTHAHTHLPHTPPTHMHLPRSHHLWLMFRFGTGDTVVSGVTIADGSRDINTEDIGI